MMTEAISNPDRIVIFRTCTTEDEDAWVSLCSELREGRLRQGWGKEGMALEDESGKRIEKEQWSRAHEECFNERPSSKRYSILVRMLDIGNGEVVVVPKMPGWNQFIIARVSMCKKPYEFESFNAYDDFGHIIHVEPDTVRIFDYRADNEAYLISGLFSRANHWSPVTFAYGEDHIEAACNLLKRRDNTEGRSSEELDQAALDDALKKAAGAMQEVVKTWNGKRFEKAVIQSFRNQGYQIENYRTYDGQGADADLVVSPPNNRYSLFMPEKIAVQIKWKQGIDYDDIKAVDQLVRWRETDDVKKYVISSADDFTEECKEKAEREDITLIGGLHTMYFLMGLPNQYRED